MNKLFLLPLIPMLILSGCSKVLSKRTDEQAWAEFEQEVKVSRRPAASQNLFLEEALSVVPVRSILLKCGFQVSVETCYRASLTLQFDEIFLKTQNQHPELKSKNYRQEQKEFFSSRSFELVLSEVNRFHQSILSGIEFRAQERAEMLFENCEQEKKNDAIIERFDLFTGGTTEIPKGMYACLSSKWLQSEDQLLDETSDRLGLTIVTKEAKAWIEEHQISKGFETAIQGIAEKKAKVEHAQFENEKDQIMSGFNGSNSDEVALKEWAPKLRERFQFSPVEQWILEYKKGLHQ